MTTVKIEFYDDIKFVDDGSKQNILIVEDEKLVLNMLEIFMSKWGYNPISAKNTEESIIFFEALHNRGLKPDLILMDIKMPGNMINGLMCAQYLKDKFGFDDFIYMSGFLTETDTQNELKKSGKICIAKPFEVLDLRNTIDQFLRNGKVS